MGVGSEPESAAMKRTHRIFRPSKKALKIAALSQAPLGGVGAVSDGWCGPLPMDPKACVAITVQEFEALKNLSKAYEALKNLGWQEARYAPMGVDLEVIEPGSTGIHKAYRDEQRRFWVYDGDEWPSDPCLYREVSK